MGDSIGPKGRPVLATSFREEAAAALPVLRRLTREQEAQLVLDRKLLLVAVCALNHWSAEEIVAAYQITRAECVKPDLRACANGLGRRALQAIWLPQRNQAEALGLSPQIGGDVAAMWADSPVLWVNGLLDARTLHSDPSETSNSFKVCGDFHESRSYDATVSYHARWLPSRRSPETRAVVSRNCFSSRSNRTATKSSSRRQGEGPLQPGTANASPR